MDNFLKAFDSSVYLVTTCLYRSCNCLTSPGVKLSVSESMKGNVGPVTCITLNIMIIHWIETLKIG